MKRRAFMGLGATSIGVGALYGTGAFSSVSAGRGISVNAADGTNALVGLDIADSVASNSNGERLVTVTNNFEATLDITIELTEQAADDDTISLVDGTLPLGAGDTDDILVDLSEPNPDTDEITFDLTADTDTASVTLSRGDVTVTNPGGGGGDGPAEFASGDLVLENGTFTHDLSFDAEALGNNDTVTIDLSDAHNVGADYSAASVERVDGPSASDLELDQETQKITYSPQGNASGTLTLRVSDIEVDGDGGTATATYEDTEDRTDEDTFSVPVVGRDGDSLDTSDSAIVPDEETIGEADVGGDLDMGDSTTANSEVEVGGDLTGGEDTTFHGEVEAEGDAEFGDGTIANNEVEVDGDVTAGNFATFHGELGSEGDVTLGTRTTVSNEVEADGDIAVGSDSVLHGEVESEGDITLEDGVTFNSDIAADGTVYIGCNVTENGSIDAASVERTCE